MKSPNHITIIVGSIDLHSTTIYQILYVQKFLKDIKFVDAIIILEKKQQLKEQ